MEIRTIRRGDNCYLVQYWQTFLRGQDVYFGVLEGIFDLLTEEATKAYQTEKGLKADGVVGNRTWGAAMQDGLSLAEDSSKDTLGPNWPPRPQTGPMSYTSRLETFGQFKIRPAPTPGNPEGIQILGDWVQKNIRSVRIPQLVGILGAPPNGEVFWHKSAVSQLLDMFQKWEEAGLSRLILSYGGTWNPRFTRGSRSTLSNHAFATAIDLNVPWNMLGRQPALVGQKGSVRELVEIATQCGFWWGGWGWPPTYNRLDGMHFEVAAIR